MKDPTRIPVVLEELRAVWEGQPDLSLATLFGILANRGIGWGSDDADLRRELQRMSVDNPARLPAHPTGRYRIRTESPANLISVDPYRITVRRRTPGREPAQPGVWHYSELGRCVVGVPMSVRDTEGIDHRLGVVTGIELLDPDPAEFITELSGRTRENWGDEVVHLTLEDGTVLLLGRRLEVFTAHRRELQQHSHSWRRLLKARAGADLIVELARGGTHNFGVLRTAFRVE